MLHRSFAATLNTLKYYDYVCKYVCTHTYLLRMLPSVTLVMHLFSIGSYAKFIFSHIFAAVVIILAIAHLASELSRCKYSFRDYIRNFQNYNELFLFPMSIVYVFAFADDCGCPKDWQWQIGIFVMFSAWINLIIIVSEFPKTGTYVIIFKEIFLTFMKMLLSFGILLVLAYSIILFMMFSNPISMVSNKHHSIALFTSEENTLR